ncbi:MAG: TonB family protein [Mailhella sp.]|nr:TonB family protein [Mailhella sp.]
MTDGQRIAAGIAASLFLHFCLLTGRFAMQEAPDTFRAVLEIEGESAARAAPPKQGTGIHSASPQTKEEAEEADRKRRAYLRYLDAVDAAVHARRLEVGAEDLIGVAVCAFDIHADGGFSEPSVLRSSGDARLDDAALRAIRAAGGAVKRPAILGTDVIRMTLEVKYQYGLR